MEAVEISNEVMELKLAALKAKAVAEAFSREFMENDARQHLSEAVQCDPEGYVYLFCALSDLIFELTERVQKLDGMV